MFKLPVSKTTAAKRIVSTIVGFSVSSVVRTIITNNCETDDPTLSEETKIIVSSHVLGMMAANMTKEFTDSQIDDAVALWKKIQDERKNKPTSD